jgi:hypothetical protein
MMVQACTAWSAHLAMVSGTPTSGTRLGSSSIPGAHEYARHARRSPPCVSGWRLGSSAEVVASGAPLEWWPHERSTNGLGVNRYRGRPGLRARRGALEPLTQHRPKLVRRGCHSRCLSASGPARVARSTNGSPQISAPRTATSRSGAAGRRWLGRPVAERHHPRS